MASLKSVKFSQPKMMPVDGRAVFFNDSYAVAANPTAGDTIDFHLPAGVEINTLRFHSSDLDTGGPELASKIGYRKAKEADTLTAVADYFAPTGTTLGQAAGITECRFPPKKFDVDVIVSITIEVDSATFAAGTIYMIAGCNCHGPK